MTTLTERLAPCIASAAFKLAGALPVRAQRILAGSPISIDGQELHPEIQLILRMINLLPDSTFEQLPLAQARAQIDLEAALFGGPPAPMKSVEDIDIPGPAGPIPTRLYRPCAVGNPTGLLVYYHGGGFVVGSLQSCDSVCRFLAHHANLAVLSVAYRLAPEHPYPAAVDDAVAAFRHTVNNAHGYGIEPHRIGVAGDSAGGNLAAVVAQLTTNDNEQSPAIQALFFPWVDLATKRPSHSLFHDGFFLTDAQLDWYRNHYLPDIDSAEDPAASPLRATDLTGLPPAYIALAGFDPLRDEGNAYANRLRQANVPITLRNHTELIHAFVNTTGVGRTGRSAMLEAASAIRAIMSFATATSRPQTPRA